MGAIFICLKNTFQRHFGKLYARISHIVVEYLLYSGTTKLPPSLNILHIQAQQIVPHACRQTVCQLPTIYTIAIKAPQFCNAHFTILHHTFYNSATHKSPDVRTDSSCPPLRRYCFVAEYSSPPPPFIPLSWVYTYTQTQQSCPYRC